MDPLVLGLLVATTTIFILFSGISVANGLLVVSAIFLLAFDGFRSLELIPEVLFGKLDNFALLSIPMFILMGAAIASTRAGADLYEALDRWLTRVPGGLVVSNLGACALLSRGPLFVRPRGYGGYLLVAIVIFIYLYSNIVW